MEGVLGAEIDGDRVTADDEEDENDRAKELSLILILDEPLITSFPLTVKRPLTLSSSFGGATTSDSVKSRWI